MLTNPRTVCACQPVASMISASVAPLARLIIAITSAFLLLRSEGLFAAFLAGASFFVALAFLAGVRVPVGFFDSGSLAWPFPANSWIAAHTRATAFLRSWNFFS